MHLSSINIKGFKSFSERTELAFSPGVSVIVGPNGCGKSNITDAVLWALGEQSPLSVRGSSMQDMIFAGGEGRGPSQAAEVEVVLDCSDGGDPSPLGFSEISVRRRLDRSGEGEYRLNGARCRLADVVEALSDANLGQEMHSVISQGRVEEIVHSKPRQRRALVEEAAGLGKHRKRRRRAQLKLERTQDNLDRALDVEREARSRLRPLKRQAEAADIHARLEREAAELRAVLLAAELGSHDSDLSAAESRAKAAREERGSIDAELAKAGERRSAIEAELAERDRERSVVWEGLSGMRGDHERLTVRGEALVARRADVLQAVERRRARLGALADELDRLGEPSDGEDPVGAGLDRIADALGEATAGLDAARAAAGDDQRLAGLGRVRSAGERANGLARRLEELLGRRRQGSLTSRLEDEARIAELIAELADSTAKARDAVGARVSALEARIVGERQGDDVADRLRACSRAEAEIQGRLRIASDKLTEAQVAVAHLGERRGEAAAELARVAEVLGRDLEASTEPLDDERRFEIEQKLSRVARRREALGPVNPLAQSEYDEALAHVEELETQRTDLEAALSELRGLIRETDATIEREFAETFAATERNFTELVEHLFPGGKGRLRLVSERTPEPVLGGAAPGGDAEEGSAEPDSGAEEASSDEESGPDPTEGVEIEVTPSGKATRKLSLLSGGEKALVALAFVFSVFLARPSPFYILDEVEAALDDANIDRFLQLVRRFSDRAQFVIVTHQKRTMDCADVLYGVSMGGGGVTKVVSRKFDDGVRRLTEAA
ncbi:AAA family ATPase [Thermoleophilia bacterium SCSIO 60948]|nr:AAA family ATPase [Thermoleophilia bacterium SCSIO 60948]